MTEESLCPITKRSCVKERCTWYSETYEDSCAVNAIELHLNSLKEYFLSESEEK